MVRSGQNRSIWLLLGSSASFWVLGHFLSTRLPDPKNIDQEIYRAPIQEEVKKNGFNVQVGDVPYHVTPKATYELKGLVVSEHHSDSLADYYHRATNDYFNICDLAVLWGLNAKTGIYQKGNFHNQDFTAWVHYDDSMDWLSFRMNEFSNNHLITEDPALRKRLENIEVGDQVRIKGYLAEYFWPPAHHRGTSLTRDDSGNHACETIYVTEANVIESANTGWRMIRTAGKVLTLTLVAVQLFVGIKTLFSKNFEPTAVR